MRDLRSMVLGLTACAVLALAGTAAADTAPADEPVSLATMLAAATTGDYCDVTPDHGTSGSCEDEGKANGQISCPAGQHPANITCSVGQACASAGSPGHWCKCDFRCRKNFEVEPIDPSDPADPFEPHQP